MNKFSENGYVKQAKKNTQPRKTKKKKKRVERNVLTLFISV